MDRIANTTSLISGVVKAYKQPLFQNKLQGVMTTLCERFETFLDENAHNSALTSENSVRSIKYYSVSGRVKEPDSFYEKMIRGNLIFKFLDQKSYTSRKEIEKNKSEAQKIIKSISDDIIGIRILMGLEDDCKKVLKLLIDNHSASFNNKRSIWLNMSDLEKQPVRMRNGLLIYKIKGIYNLSYQFELQIKSKLLSVWGDMDHSMFYKDYSVSPVKDNVKKSMVNLGRLIMQVDQFMHQIREAEESFSKNREVIDFTEKFSSAYSEAFKEKLGFGYRLEDISEFLFYMYRNLPSDKKNVIARLDFSILTVKSQDSRIQSYVNVRNKDFNLHIIELVYFDWFSKNIKEKNRKKINYTRVVSQLLDDYLEFLDLNVKSQYSYNSQYLKRNFYRILSYLNSGVFLYNFDKLNSFYSALSNITIYSDLEVGKYTELQKDYIQNVLLLIFYDEDAEGYFRSIQEAFVIDDLIRTFSSIKFSFHDKRIREISSFGSTQELIQKCLSILKLLSDEISH